MSMAAGNLPASAGADPVARLNAAILADQAGDAGLAQDRMRRIAADWPDWDEPWFRLGQSLRATGSRDAAIAAYEAARMRGPHRAGTLISLGLLRLQAGDAKAARALLTEATERHPDNHEALAALGITLLAAQEPALAAAAFHAATVHAPGNLLYAVHEIESLEICDKTAEAEAVIAARLAADPADGVASFLAARAAFKQGDLAEAETLLEVARALLPDEAAVAAMLGNVHMLAMRPELAAVILREARELAPDDVAIAHDHAVALARLYRYAEAEDCLTAALARSGPRPDFLSTRANQRASLGDLNGAFADIDEAVRLAPGSADPLRTRGALLAYRSGTGAAELREAMARLGQAHPRCPSAPHQNIRNPDRKLRIGLLSNTLRAHPVGWLTLPGVEALDQDSFSIHCFGRRETQDFIAHRFARRAQSWDGCETLGDAALAAKIREREIDILIDLGGYGDAGRITALVHRPAPVQVKWVGMQCATSGLAEMDWFITDRWETPGGFDPFYTERLLRLDDGYICYLPPHYAPEVTPLPALENGFVTFGCFNNLTKFTGETLAAWAAILRNVPASRLVLRCPQLSEDSIVARLRGRCAEAGLDPARLHFIGRTPHHDFLAGYNKIDIALDPFPYSGGLTTCESLYMGVPVITRAGEIFAARHSVSHLSNAGLADWVAAEVPDYIDRATSFANDLPALAELRHKLRAQMLASPLCDAPRFGRSLGKALRHAWHRYCAETR